MLAALALGAISACSAGVDDNPFTSTFTGTPQTSAPAGVTTFEDTESPTTTDEDSDQPSGSADDTMGMDTTQGPASTSVADTTSGDTCVPACGPDEVCTMGVCVPTDDPTTTGPAACNDVPGNYTECLGPGDVVDTSACGTETASCLTGGDPVITGVCAVTSCVDACDCPAPPISGNAVVTCDAITGDPENFCYLDCSNGETCPTGMLCFAEIACIWPGEGADGVPYGDCFNNGQTICGLDGICLSDDATTPTVSVCTDACNSVADCPSSPGGGAAVVCDDLTGDGASECSLDCSVGSCPAGMTCYGGFLCMWN